MNSSNSIDWSSTAAWIALAIAIIIPILNSIISNRHAIKLKELDFFQKTRMEMLSQYIDETSSEIKYTGHSEEYEKIYNKIFLYAPEDVWADIEKLDLMINTQKEKSYTTSKQDKQECTRLLIHIAKKFSQIN